MYVQEFLEKQGYVELPACSYGDYGGDGVVGHANIRWLRKKYNPPELYNHPLHVEVEIALEQGHLDPKLQYETITQALQSDVVIVYGPYDSAWAMVRKNTGTAEELFKQLKDYPVFNDELISEVELEWIEEAWETWVAFDLGVDENDEKAFDVYWERMMAGDCPYVTEHAGIYIPDEVLEEIKQKLIEKGILEDEEE